MDGRDESSEADPSADVRHVIDLDVQAEIARRLAEASRAEAIRLTEIAADVRELAADAHELTSDSPER